MRLRWHVGKDARWLIEWIKDPNGTDQTSHILEKSHKNINTIDFKVIDDFNNNKGRRKIDKVFCIKIQQSTLSTQDKSIQLSFLIDE